jgi:leader peptidase (prepilin peptidase) / N-methyltransferase
MHIDELFALLGRGFLRGTVFVFGLLWGSFLNVVIYRVPREMSVVRPASHCPGCGKPIAPYDNVPVVSYVLLRGRARCCKAPMSPRYPLVELIGGMLSLAVFEVIVLNPAAGALNPAAGALGLPSTTSLGHAAAIYTASFSLCMGLVAAAFIDAEHMYLPDSIMIGGAVIGVVTATLRGMTITESLIGAAIGFVGIWLPFIFLYKGLLGRTGMGLGDAKLLALAGAWFGWPGAVFTLLAGAVQGSIYALCTAALGIEPKLPDAVLEDIADLEKAAAEGDEDAKKALKEDPLTEDENDAFIIRFFQRLFRSILRRLGREAPEPSETASADVASDDVGSDDAADDEVNVSTRARIPFGPFLILAILELLFAGDWLKSQVFAWL